jgi:chromosome condensin MukBEF MukE localization factor
MRGIELLELAPQLVDVDANRRVLGHVEIGTAAKHFHGDDRLLRGAAGTRAGDQVFEQAMQLIRPSEHLARTDMVGMKGQLIGIGHRDRDALLYVR